MVRVLVCGGRDFTNAPGLYAELSALHTRRPFTALMHGMATGADRAAGRWARSHGIEELTFEPDWARYGNHAGRMRNAHMLREGKPDLVIAFPGNNGTRHMVRIARQENVEVIESKVGRYVPAEVAFGQTLWR